MNFYAPHYLYFRNLKTIIMKATEKQSLKIIRQHLDNLENNYNYYSPKMNEIRNGLNYEESYQNNLK